MEDKGEKEDEEIKNVVANDAQLVEEKNKNGVDTNEIKSHTNVVNEHKIFKDNA